ncbi:MAG: competence/damage-inducible protein A [Gemmatimonadaceae bacterium]
MNIEIVTIGDELLLGLTVDTNAAFLARELAGHGVSIVRRSTVGDDASHIADAVRQGIERTGAVITTGGLGPTADDMTKPAIADIFGRSLHLDEARWEELRKRWRERGRLGEIPDSNKQQVMIPDGARVLHNRHGSAPGIFLEDDSGRWVAMLPGVPREMRGLYHDELLPLVQRRLGNSLRVVRTSTVRTTAVAESQLPNLLGDAAGGFDGMSLAYLPGEEGVDLRLTIRDATSDEADERLHRGTALLRERIGKFVYAEGRMDMAEVVLQACREQSLTIAMAESCTGGLLGQRLTAIPGSSDVMLGGVVAYSNAVKISAAGVSGETLDAFGAVSEAVAQELATGVRLRLSAEIGVGITGIAGPGGGTPEKPVGQVWIAIDVRGVVKTFGGRLIGDRAEIRFRATQIALDMVRRALSAAD